MKILQGDQYLGTGAKLRRQADGATLINENGFVMPKRTVNSQLTSGNQTYTAAQLLGGILLRDPNGGNVSDTLPAASTLLASMPGAYVGASFEFVVRNTADAAETITVQAGTGVTISGTATIAQNNTKIFLVVVTGVGSSAAYSVYSVGTLVH